MSHKQLDTLIRMINQIAANNGAYPHDEAAERVASHLQRFWARSMKTMIIEYRLSEGDELSPIAKEAVAILAQAAVSKQQGADSAVQA
ncbi:formate dehydrogenase subunit delta [Methylophaga sp.]|jgi:formate dehydrogenase subunit delta|uniref:formate dehydrogenase subunit delta n=1 Tax=Methylophaga sp. TaxID=2024840 RepID=UPI00140148FA|nr:formate dehydrogenase subunit delta [Methylophaga sp.]MTI64601.1 formate dehydrogenase [Methylophaga sp.]